VHVREKTIVVQCGAGPQKIIWLGHVGIARYDKHFGSELGMLVSPPFVCFFCMWSYKCLLSFSIFGPSGLFVFVFVDEQLYPFVADVGHFTY
jgi:hypothetical protein